jgi:hypothetical protein
MSIFIIVSKNQPLQYPLVWGGLLVLAFIAIVASILGIWLSKTKKFKAVKAEKSTYHLIRRFRLSYLFGFRNKVVGRSNNPDNGKRVVTVTRNHTSMRKINQFVNRDERPEPENPK